jgi:predicted nucleic acid-binding protein
MTLFVDANVPMYVVGAAHPNKDRALAALEVAVARGERLVTDAEVLQELLHRYRAIGRIDWIDGAMDSLLSVVDEVFPIDADDIRAAQRILERMPALSARDAVHVATMRRHGVDDILTFDTGFDAVGGLRRLPT